MRLSNIKVSTKLIGGFIIVALISVVVGFFGITNMSKINDSAAKMYEKELLGVAYIKDTNIELLSVAREWRSALLATNSEDRMARLDGAKNHLKKMEDTLHKAGQLFYTKEGKAKVEKLIEAHREWEVSIEKLIALIPNENVTQLSQEAQELQKIASVQLKSVDEVLDNLSQIKSDNAENASKNIQDLYQFSRNIMLIVIAFGLLFGIGLGYFISKAITKPLSHAVMIANKLSVGDTSSDVVVTGTDEVGQLLSAMSSMLESVKASFLKAQENTRIKQALDATSTNVMLADANRNIVYMNHSVMKMLREAESDLRKALPHFSVDKVIGSNMDIFHKNPAHQSHLLASLTSTYTGNIVVAGRSFRLIASPIFSEKGERIGSVVEWQDRTQEVSVEAEINHLVDAAVAGNFTARISTEGKNGFFLKLAEGLNALVQTADKGLNDVARVLGAIAKGDLTEKIDAEYLGTFGELKNYCNDTTESLITMLSDIRSAAETIYTASSEIATGNADLSSRTEQQAANLEETASSMEELTSTVKLNADNAKQANVLAEQASTVAYDGGSLIQQVVTTMNDINQSSQKIADIIGVIDGIAFQTNILALNAAVEAARAGDQGRGFAVVASEVRTLAQRSANAAKDIKGLISDSVHKIESGNALVSKSGDTMKEIVTAIKRVNDIMAEIAAASAEQSTGIEEVSTAVSQMDEMTQQNAALVEEAAAAAESLQSQADQLNRSVSQFKLSNEAQSGAMARLSPPKTKAAAKLNSDKPAARKKISPPKTQQDDEWEQF